MTGRTSASLRAHGGPGVGDEFASVVLADMGLEASVSEKVPMTRVATLSGFEVSGVGMQEIGALFLPTGSAQLFLVASMQSLGVVRFPTISTDVTGPEKTRQTSNDIIMVMVVQQNQLFVSKGSKGSDVERSMRIH